jgi:hypothetical protein
MVNKTDIVNLLIEDTVKSRKKAKDFCEYTCKCRLDKRVILTTYPYQNIEHLYNVFKEVRDFLSRTIVTKNTAYYSCLRKNITNIFEKQYSMDIKQETLADLPFLNDEVPKYLNYVKIPEMFFNDLWNSLKQCGFDDETIAIAWITIINVSGGYSTS